MAALLFVEKFKPSLPDAPSAPGGPAGPAAPADPAGPSEPVGTDVAAGAAVADAPAPNRFVLGIVVGAGVGKAAAEDPLGLRASSIASPSLPEPAAASQAMETAMASSATATRAGDSPKRPRCTKRCHTGGTVPLPESPCMPASILSHRPTGAFSLSASESKWVCRTCSNSWSGFSLLLITVTISGRQFPKFSA